MLVRRLALTNLRSRRELEVVLGPGLTILAGPNGAGKTTVLEAITLVLRGTTLRPGAVRDLIKRDKDFLRVEMELASSGSTPEASVTAAVAYTRGGERRLTANGATLADSSRWREILPLRTFIPDDLRLIKGSPRRRREYLDSLGGPGESSHAAALRQYDEALAQRNALLRTRRSAANEDHFLTWETILARTGLAVSQWRARRLGEFVGRFQRMHADLTGDPPESLRLVYRTNVVGLDEDGYRTKLAETREVDQQRTFTHLGPHRDDIRLIREGLDVRDCASQGEQRAALLTLVLAEWEHLYETARKPLLLLDDVMSELDEPHRRALVRVIDRGGQAVVTTTDLRYFSTEELGGATVVELPGV